MRAQLTMDELIARNVAEHEALCARIGRDAADHVLKLYRIFLQARNSYNVELLYQEGPAIFRSKANGQIKLAEDRHALYAAMRAYVAARRKYGIQKKSQR